MRHRAAPRGSVRASGHVLVAPPATRLARAIGRRGRGLAGSTAERVRGSAADVAQTSVEPSLIRVSWKGMCFFLEEIRPHRASFLNPPYERKAAFRRLHGPPPPPSN